MERIRILSNNGINKAGRYVLYWVQASPRVSFNHALELACDKANKLKQPVLACFCLTSGNQFHDQANVRHYSFMLDGLCDLRKQLEKRKISLVVAEGTPLKVVLELAKEASEVVVDQGYLRVQRQWYQEVADKINCTFTQVETNVVVPVEIASDKEEFAARTIRPKLSKHAANFLKPVEEIAVQKNGLNLHLPKSKLQFVDLTTPEDVDEVLESLEINRSVPQVEEFPGGHSAAVKLLHEFCSKKLAKYEEARNTPGKDFQSYMSPFLHFGHISPIEIILKVQESNAPKAAKDAFIEEVFIRRELSMNFVWFNPDNYDSLECLPDWAVKTIREHKKDKREHVYSEKELEEGQTHDIYWNACQLEMVHSGKMHGYMRMYWGKKVIEWTPNMETAYDFLMKMNDKYELDGRDPNGYTGVAWCFGKHDRAHQERPIFGKLRYMVQDGLIRKYKDNMYKYASSCYEMAGRNLDEEEQEQPSKKKSKK